MYMYIIVETDLNEKLNLYYHKTIKGMDATGKLRVKYFLNITSLII